MPWRQELHRQHQQRKSDSLWRTRHVTQSPADREIKIDGQTLLNFCSNNYLSLANDQELVQASVDAVQRFGTSTSASHLIVGHGQLHQQLETTIADWVGAEQAILFSTGYMANLAVPATFLDRHDLLIQDKLNHASIIDGGQITRAKVRRYAHNDVAAANKILRQSDHPRKLLITDGVFSMDGDIAPIAQLKTACDHCGAVMLVDDAHGLGVVGDQGKGCLEDARLRPAGNVLLLGTLSKAAGSFGAFIAGDAVYIETLIQHARSSIYTTALPSSVVAASLRGIELLRRQSWRREKLHDNIRFFCDTARKKSIPVAPSNTPIQPTIVGDSDTALRLSRQLRDEGFMTVAIRPPTVPPGQSRLRITLMTDHQHHDIERLIEAIGRLL